MMYRRVVIFIALQVSTILFASDEKGFIPSQKDYDWLGKESELILRSKDPQLKIASHMAFVVNHRKLLFDGDKHLQKNIEQAQKWLGYFNEKKKLDSKKQLEYCRALKNSAQYIRVLGNGKKELELAVFLKLLPFAFDVEQCKKAQNNIFGSFCSMVYEGSSSASMMNSFIYFYKPSLYSFNKDGRSCLDQLISSSFWGGLLYESDLKELLRPTLYELAETGVIKYTYTQVQQVLCNKRSAEAFLCVLKAKKIKIHKPVLNTIFFEKYIFEESIKDFSRRYQSVTEFNSYCDQVEEDASKCIALIHENSSDFYKGKLSRFLFLTDPQAFKKWYEKLKLSNKKDF